MSAPRMFQQFGSRGPVPDSVLLPAIPPAPVETNPPEKRRKHRRTAQPDALPTVEQFHRLRAAGIDRAKQLDREADDLEARAYALRLEAFQLTNHARLAARHAPPGDG